MIVRIMRRPRPKKPAAKTADFTRCANCVTKKKCDEAGKCLYGTKAKSKRKLKNGRVSTK